MGNITSNRVQEVTVYALTGRRSANGGDVDLDAAGAKDAHLADARLSSQLVVRRKGLTAVLRECILYIEE